MFVPVSCTSCGKPFQVPETALGKLAPCPWCEAIVTALPASAPQDAPTPDAPEPPKPVAPAPEPLSLDDDPAPKQKPTALPVARPVAPPTAAPRPDERRPVPLVLKLLLLGFVMIVVAAATLGALRRKDGHLVSTEWKRFTAPDGTCSIDLLGRPVEDPDLPATGARRYASQGWYSGTKTWIGWRELRPDEASLAAEIAAAEKAIKEWEKLHPNEVSRVGAPPQPQGLPLLRSSLFNPEIERLKSTFDGYGVKDATIQFEPPLTVEVRLETPTGPLVERIVVKVDGPRPRAYFIGMTGKRLNPDGPEVGRLFASFRVND